MQPKIKSIFDVIEEKAALPTIFEWSTNLDMSTYGPEDFIYEGELFTVKDEASLPSKRRYVLTLSGLIQYKVTSLSNSAVEIESAPSKEVSQI